MRNNPTQIEQIAKQNNIHDYIFMVDLKMFDKQKYIYVKDEQFTYFSNSEFPEYLLKMEIEMHPESKNIKTIRFNKPVYIEELKFMNEDYNQYTLVGSFKGKDQY